jgi:hypothetical protein
MMDIQQLLTQYPYEKPKPQVQLWLLLFITIGGLIALFLAAYHAFQLVASPPQAFFAALLIEVGLVVEAIALINRPKTWYPWAGLIIGFLVSGTYNYTQAAKAGQDLSGLELFALAFGPLSALAFVSLTLGNELRAYQEKGTEWERARVEWAERERKRLENKEERRQAKAESTGNLPVNFRQPSASVDLPPWLPQVPVHLREFKYMVDEGLIILPPGLTGSDLQKHIPAVGTDRTGRNWLEAVGYRQIETNGKEQ